MKIFGKRILSLMLSVYMLISMLTGVAHAKTVDEFTDFPNNWSTEALIAAVDNGLLHGYEDHTIRAGALLTRAEMITIIVNAFGAVIPADITAYTDVPADAWYYDKIAKGVNMGIIAGDGQGHMFPENAITREEAFTIVARAMVLSAGDTAALDKFTDKGSISPWAVGPLAALAAKGYINGDELSCINPKNFITRAEFAVLMDNIFEKYYINAGTYIGEFNGCVMVNTNNITLSNMVINGDLVIGDGVHTGQFSLKNVTVNGRIVVRGGQKPGKITFNNVTLNGQIVIQNVNGTVYFNNYRSDLVFTNIVSNTPAEFKQHGGGTGGGGGGSTVTNANVRFFNKTTQVGEPVQVIMGTAVPEEKIPTHNVVFADGYKKGPSLSSVYANEFQHSIDFGWWYEDLERDAGGNVTGSTWKQFTKDTLVAEDDLVDGNLNVYVKSPKVSAQLTFRGQSFNIETFYEPDTRLADTIKDTLFIYRDAIPDAVELSGYWDRVRENGRVQKVLNVNDDIMILKASLRLSQFIEDDLEEFITENILLVPDGNTELQAVFDTLVDQLRNQEQFTITDETVFIADGFRDILTSDKYKYENYVATKIPDHLKKIFEIYPEQYIKDIYADMIGTLVAQIDAAKLEAQAGRTGYVDCSLTAVVNPISEVYAPFYEGLKYQLENTIGNKIYYNQNPYLRPLVELLAPENIFVGTAVANKYESDVSGYKILSLDEYYDLIYKAAVLADDAILWYHEHLEGGAKVDEVSDAYEDLVLEYANIISDIMEAYVNDSTLPLSQLSPIEQAIKNAYPSLVQALVDRYKSSPFNKDYDSDDFQKLQDAVARVIQEVNMTTNDFFDRVLANGRLDGVDQLTKVNADQYELSFRGIMATLIREISRD